MDAKGFVACYIRRALSINSDCQRQQRDINGVDRKWRIERNVGSDRADGHLRSLRSARS